jgi:hypothetical protein
MSAISAASYLPRFSMSKFYVIKSYTEEDVHKAIKYNIWSSTPRGNQILDKAFCDLQLKKKTHKYGDDPESKLSLEQAEVYLFFSVNKSKHFCGMAKMLGRVQNDVNHE